jgi:hypothetical protein
VLPLFVSRLTAADGSAAAEGERTKYKAMIRYNARFMAQQVGKDADAIEAELEPEWVQGEEEKP